MKLLLSMVLAVCLLQQEKRITLRFVNQYNELLPIFAYWNDYYQLPKKQDNISFMRTIEGVSPQIVVTKRFVRVHVISGNKVIDITLEPSDSGVIDIMLPTNDMNEGANKNKNTNTGKMGGQKKSQKKNASI